MNLLAPIKTIMTTKLITVGQYEPMLVVDDIFKTSHLHHIPVLDKGNLVGIISKSDYNLFLRGFKDNAEDNNMNRYRLRSYKVGDIMTSKLATLDEEDKINLALDIFNKNMFHALPILRGDTLVGILTTFDIISTLAKDGFAISEY